MTECTGYHSWSDMMKCRCYECFKERKRIRENAKLRKRLQEEHDQKLRERE